MLSRGRREGTTAPFFLLSNHITWKCKNPLFHFPNSSYGGFSHISETACIHPGQAKIGHSCLFCFVFLSLSTENSSCEVDFLSLIITSGVQELMGSWVGDAICRSFPHLYTSWRKTKCQKEDELTPLPDWTRDLKTWGSYLDYAELKWRWIVPLNSSYFSVLIINLMWENNRN